MMRREAPVHPYRLYLLGQDGIPVLELRGIGMASLPSEDLAPTLPRLAWQSFVKSLTPR